MKMIVCEWCGKTMKKWRGGRGHSYCSSECGKQSRRMKAKLRHRGYLYLMGKDKKRHPVKVNKRPRPEDCELCHRTNCRLDYHHWDNIHPEKGMWICHRCHYTAEDYEKGLIDRYIQLREEINGV